MYQLFKGQTGTLLVEAWTSNFRDPWWGRCRDRGGRRDSLGETAWSAWLMGNCNGGWDPAGLRSQSGHRRVRARHFCILSPCPGAASNTQLNHPHKPPHPQASSRNPHHRIRIAHLQTGSAVTRYPSLSTQIQPRLLSLPPHESSSHSSASLLTHRRIKFTVRHWHFSTPTATLEITVSAIQCSRGSLCRNEHYLPSQCGAAADRAALHGEVHF